MRSITPPQAVRKLGFRPNQVGNRPYIYPLNLRLPDTSKG